MAKILVVDDEKIIVKGIRFSLLQDQMEVDCAYDGEQAVEMARNTEYDVVLLDVMLPKLDGFQVCQAIREFSNMPIIMLTAKGDDMDKILGLEYGADDYITKPFNILEVKARIKAIMRRSSNTMIHPPQPPENSTDIVTGDLRLDVQGRRLFILGSEINVKMKITSSDNLSTADIMLAYDANSLEFIEGTNAEGGNGAVRVHGDGGAGNTTTLLMT